MKILVISSDVLFQSLCRRWLKAYEVVEAKSLARAQQLLPDVEAELVAVLADCKVRKLDKAGDSQEKEKEADLCNTFEFTRDLSGYFKKPIVAVDPKLSSDQLMHGCTHEWPRDQDITKLRAFGLTVEASFP